MSIAKKFTGTQKSFGAGVSLALLGITGGTRTQVPAPDNGGKQAAAAQSKFYCNIKALSPSERARHKQLTDKLLALRKDVVESEKGYEFQYSPKEVSLPEIVEWVEAEGKCCPFFDFHIDVENEGTLLCLRLTGAEGVKAFVRSEFHVAK
jgi:hypothetical protein